MKHAIRFADSGYTIANNVISGKECEDLLAAISDSAIRRGRAGARHLMADSTIAAFAADRRLLEIARSALGLGAVAFRATLFEKSGHANWLVVWHQDTALPLASRFNKHGWGPWSQKAGVL